VERLGEQIWQDFSRDYELHWLVWVYIL
jgi:hypothetical protein